MLTHLSVRTNRSFGEIGSQKLVCFFSRFAAHSSSKWLYISGVILRYSTNLFSSSSSSRIKWWYSPCTFRDLFIGCTENRRGLRFMFLFLHHHHKMSFCRLFSAMFTRKPTVPSTGWRHTDGKRADQYKRLFTRTYVFFRPHDRRAYQYEHALRLPAGQGDGEIGIQTQHLRGISESQKRPRLDQLRNVFRLRRGYMTSDLVTKNVMTKIWRHSAKT